MADPAPETPPAEAPPSDWHADMSAGHPDRAETYSRFKSRNDFHDAFFEQRTKISQSMIPPDPSSENYLGEVKQARLKLGGKATAAEYTVTIPDDVEGMDREAFTKKVTETAAKFGVTQSELDEQVEGSIKTFREGQASRKEADDKAERAKVDIVAEYDRVTNELWGGRKEVQVANATLAAKHFDNGLFQEDNKMIPEEVRAEKGGVLQQKMKNDPVLTRFLAVWFDKNLSEGNPPRGGSPAANQPQTNVQVQRYEEAQARWPKRNHDFWDRYAKGT